MPFFAEGDQGRAQMTRGDVEQAGPADPFAPAPDPWGAAFRQQNPVVSVIEASRNASTDLHFDPSWNPLSVIRGTPYERDHLDDFLGDQNESQTRTRMAQIDQEEKDRQTLAGSGWAGTVASIAAGLTDPLSYIPVIGEGARGLSAARTALSTAGRMAATGALSSAASEAVLQSSQATRPAGESLGNIASGTILMGLLGGGAGAMLSRSEAKAAAGALDEARPDFSHPPADLAAESNQGVGLPSDAGAATADTRTLKLKPVVPSAIKDMPYVGAGVEKAGDFLSGFSPTLRVFSSDSVVAKRAMADMAETPLVFEDNAQGVPTSYGAPPLDRLIKTQSRQIQMDGNAAIEDAYVDYRYGQTPPSFLDRQQNALADLRGQTGYMTQRQFGEEVHRALYSGDQHPIPQVQRAARDQRRIYDKVAKVAQETKGPDGQPMLAQELKPPPGDQSYAPRVWNKEAIVARRNDVRERFADWYEREQGKKASIQDELRSLSKRLETAGGGDEGYSRSLRSRMEDLLNAWEGKSAREAQSAIAERGGEPGEQLKAVDKGVERILKSKQNLTREELSNRADETIDRIIGSPDGRLDYDEHPTVGPPRFGGGQQVRGSLKSRDFAIPTALVHDFVEHDPQHLMSSYLRSVLPDVMLTQRFGDLEMRDVFRRLNEEYAEKAKSLTSEKSLVKLDAERQRQIRDLAATRDRIRGVYGWSPDPRLRNAARIANVARNWNVIADLGTSVFNRLGDLGTNAVFRHGFFNVMRDGWSPFFRGMLGQKELASAWRGQAKAMAVGVDGMMGHMRHDFGDVIDNYRPGSKFERGLAWAADRSMLVNLHGPWTDWTKTLVASVASGEMLRAMERVAGGKASGKDVERLAAANIDRAMANRIWKAYGADGGQVIEGVHVPNTRDWKDGGARAAFEAAIGREADISVITPGAEKPLWMSGPVASLMGQFRSFVAGAYERLLIANLQQRDARTLQGLITAVATGMLSYRLYTWLAGQQASDNPADWIKEGVHRSAILAWFSEANEMIGKATSGASDMYRLIGASSPLTRHDYDLPQELLGPTWGRLEGLYGAAKDATRAIIPGDKPDHIWTAQDTHRVRQLMLLQNLFAVRRLFDAAESGVNGALGIPQRDKQPAWTPRN